MVEEDWQPCISEISEHDRDEKKEEKGKKLKTCTAPHFHVGFCDVCNGIITMI